MDIQQTATQLLGFLGDNPDLISQFVQHPYSTTAQATGSDDNISKEDMSQIVTQVAAQSTHQKLGSTDTANIASLLMGQSGGSVHALTSALFGGGAAGSGAAQGSATPAAGGLGGMLDLGGLVGSLLGGGTGSAGAPSTADILAKSVMGGVTSRGLASLVTAAMGTNEATKKADATAAANAQRSSTQTAAPDFAALADLAKMFLK